METRYFPATGDNISLLGFGGLHLPLLPGGGDADIDMDTTREMVRLAMQGGVTYYDTSYIYHEGRSELALGAALRDYPRKSFNLADKLRLVSLASREEADAMFEEQLKKCQVEYFDSYLMHAYTEPLFLRGEKLGLYDLMLQKKKEGKIRRLGFSFHDTPAALRRILDSHEWDFVQITLNYVDWHYSTTPVEHDMICRRGLPIVVMRPVRGGPMANYPPEIAKLLRDADPQASAASWGMRFAASRPGVVTVLSGMSTPEQVRDNLKTFSSFKPLTAEEEALVQKAAAAHRADGVIPCTDCGECMPCPQNVNIPNILGAYNQVQKSGFFWDFENTTLRLPKTEFAHNCNQCGICAPRCPRHIDIPAHMRVITDFERSIPGLSD